MITKIRIVIESIGSIQAEIINDRNPKTAEAIINALPLESTVNRWGEEIYFTIPVNIDEEDTQTDVESGDIAYWPSGPAFCIFFGPTPISTNEKPKAASSVNVFGRIVGDAPRLGDAKDGAEIRVELIE